MRKAHVLDIGHEAVGKLIPVVVKALVGVTHPTPEMHFIDTHGPIKAVDIFHGNRFGALRQSTDNRSRARAHFHTEGVRVGLKRQLLTVGRDNFILVALTFFDSG